MKQALLLPIRPSIHHRTVRAPLCAAAVRRRHTTARLAAAAALKYIYGCCKRAVGSLTQVSAALLSTDHAAVARESNNEQVVTK